MKNEFQGHNSPSEKLLHQQKRQLRDEIRHHRREFCQNFTARQQAEKQIQTNLENLINQHQAKTLAAYVAIGSEPALHLSPHHAILLPVITTSTTGLPGIGWAWDNENLAGQDSFPGRNIPSPNAPVLPPPALSEAELVLAPALAVDSQGTRLGKGGGWYDRALQHCTAPVWVVVWDFEFFRTPHLPRAPWDIPVSGVVTPLGLWNLPTRDQPGKQPNLH